MNIDSSTLAGLVVAVVSLIKIIEKLMDWGFERFVKKNVANQIVQLDPQASAAIVELLRRTESIEEILHSKDSDGMPLVYFPRSALKDMVERQRATLDKLDELSLTIVKGNV
jgi:hypothetical protein